MFFFFFPECQWFSIIYFLKAKWVLLYSFVEFELTIINSVGLLESVELSLICLNKAFKNLDLKSFKVFLSVLQIFWGFCFFRIWLPLLFLLSHLTIFRINLFFLLFCSFPFLFLFKDGVKWWNIVWSEGTQIYLVVFLGLKLPVPQEPKWKYCT